MLPLLPHPSTSKGAEHGRQSTGYHDSPVRHLRLPFRAQAPGCNRPIGSNGTTERLLAQATVEFNRSTYTEPTRFGRDGVKDFSPRPSDIQMAIGHAGNDDYAAKNRSVWEPLVTRVNSQIVQVYLQNRIKDGEGLIVLGYKTGHGGPAEAALFDLKTRLPDQFTVLLSNLPHDADGRERLREGYDRFARYKENGLIEVCLLTDNSSPLATRLFDLDKQDWYIAKALASLLAGQVHFTTNRSLAEVGRTLGEYSAFAGLSFASRGLVPLNQPVGWCALQKVVPNLPQRGITNVTHTVGEAIEATKLALFHPDHRAIDEELQFQKPLFVVYTVPISLGDRAWIPFSNQVRKWLANHVPKAVPIFAAGKGTPDPRYTHDYWLLLAAGLRLLPDC
jgi:hypothetical protein